MRRLHTVSYLCEKNLIDRKGLDDLREALEKTDTVAAFVLKDTVNFAFQNMVQDTKEAYLSQAVGIPGGVSQGQLSLQLFGGNSEKEDGSKSLDNKDYFDEWLTDLAQERMDFKAFMNDYVIPELKGSIKSLRESSAEVEKTLKKAKGRNKLLLLSH